MSVRTLIERLSRFDPEMTVVLPLDTTGDWGPVARKSVDAVGVIDGNMTLSYPDEEGAFEVLCLFDSDLDGHRGDFSRWTPTPAERLAAARIASPPEVFGPSGFLDRPIYRTPPRPVQGSTPRRRTGPSGVSPQPLRSCAPAGARGDLPSPTY